MSKPAKGAEPPSVLQPQNLEQNVTYVTADTSDWNGYVVLNVAHLKSRRDDHQLLLVIGRGHTLEGLQPLQSVLATLGLVGGHSTDLVISTL